MRLEHVDLFYPHQPDQDVPVENLMQTLLAFKAEGKIDSMGFSDISPATLRPATAVGTVDTRNQAYHAT
ncbi:hypothetical protein C1J03_07015 [Sulfitobacter sp. SK012]|uniref:aldo/keto reductase n=1 Tax=Sulfitobacter sp. SK012 TaxID=1389005 RepID=UPI000E0AE4F3|nr:aldo/keto reductase [Sulfitobacter sp. SK012]AXI45800.1 hypothetical protein C1J03_07015 [Sulfitobacter sp. SK012]